MIFRTILGLLICPYWVTLSALADETRISAFTAYVLPEANGPRISEADGVTRWTDPEQSINWYGKFVKSGELVARVEMFLPIDAELLFKLEIEGQSHDAIVKGLGEGKSVFADFGSFKITDEGYQKLSLTMRSDPPISPDKLSIKALLLDGASLSEAHFNLKERRNAASVHLKYLVPAKTETEAFYCEVTAVEDPTATFFMACGWHRGYFGMQVNSPTERRIIFSVWDSGNEGIDRSKVKDEDRVRLLGKGKDVFTGDFGNEGTGGHSHLKYAWKTGEKQRFLVTAKVVDATHTDFAGYWFHPDQNEWILISAWRAPKEGHLLKGLHSFSENFGGANGHFVRKALYGNQWLRTLDGEWRELTTASFSHDSTGKSDRLDRFMGVESGQFFLSHGGFIDGFTSFGEKFERPATNNPPEEFKLPTIETR